MSLCLFLRPGKTINWKGFRSNLKRHSSLLYRYQFSDKYMFDRERWIYNPTKKLQLSYMNSEF